MPLTTGGAINDEGTPRRPTPEVAGSPWNGRPDARGIAGRMPWNAHFDGFDMRRVNAETVGFAAARVAYDEFLAYLEP